MTSQEVRSIALAALIAAAFPSALVAAPDSNRGTPQRLAMDMMPAQAQGQGGSMAPGGMMMDNMRGRQPGQGSMGQGGMSGQTGGMQNQQQGQSGAMGGMSGQTGQGGMMMDHMARMMDAMRGRMGGMSGIGMSPGMADLTDRIEGRIAFLKAELRITDAQTPVWNAFAEALRSGRQHLIEARKLLSDGSNANPLARLEQYERHLTERLEAVKAAREAFGRLYATLDDGQKQVANELAVPFIAAF